MSSRNPRPRTQQVAAPIVVDHRWLLKAVAVMLAVSLACAYLFACSLFYNTQWQLVLHPSRTVSHTPADVSLAFSPVRFGDDASGQPQLDGWWIPSDSATDPTVLMLHSGEGSMSDALPNARQLHDARLNVLLFDYRGFGRSGGRHPTQALMQTDAESAYSYLTSTRHVPPASLLVYGAGAGASLAVKLCASHPDVAAIILEAPEGDFAARVRRDPRASLMPFGLLFHETFPLGTPLATLATPKLIFAYTAGSTPPLLESAADPKMLVLMPRPDDAALHTALRRFLGSYLDQPPETLLPKP